MKKDKKNNQFDTNSEIVLKNRFDDNYFGFFNYVRMHWKKILIIIVCSFFFAFGQTHFLIMAGAVADGVEALSVSLASILPILKPYLTILYLALNIPLIIIFWKKIKRSFMVTTLIFLFFNAIFGFVIGFAPVEEWISENVIVIMDKGWEGHLVGTRDFSTNYVNAGWPVFVYVILAVACCSPAAAVVWKMGSSTGGMDLVAFYISNKLKKPVGNFLVITGTTMATIGILTLFITKNTAHVSFAKDINGFNHILGPQTFATFLYILLNGFIINLIYPKYKKVKLRIDTKDVQTIVNYFTKINFWHPYKIEQSTSGYTKENVYSIETVVLLLESDEIAYRIQKVSPDAWISIVPVAKIYGRFNYSKID